MAVNLVHQFGRERSRELLEQSFAQFQADKAVVGLARQLHKAEDALAGYAEAATCHLGDFMEYAALRRQISELEKGASPSTPRRPARRGGRRRCGGCKPGDVIIVPAGKFAGYAVVIDPGDGRRRAAALRRHGRAAGPPAGADRLPDPGRGGGRAEGARKSFNGRNPQMRRDLASALRQDPHP